MNLNCRPGDLAIVIYDEPICAPNIGRVVRIEGPLEYNEYFGRPCWLVYPITEDPLYCVCGEGMARGRVITELDRVDHPDAWLMTIKPFDVDITMLKSSDLQDRDDVLNVEVRALPMDSQHHARDLEEQSAKQPGQLA